MIQKLRGRMDYKNPQFFQHITLSLSTEIGVLRNTRNSRLLIFKKFIVG